MFINKKFFIPPLFFSVVSVDFGFSDEDDDDYEDEELSMLCEEGWIFSRDNPMNRTIMSRLYHTVERKTYNLNRIASSVFDIKVCGGSRLTPLSLNIPLMELRDERSSTIYACDNTVVPVHLVDGLHAVMKSGVDLMCQTADYHNEFGLMMEEFKDESMIMGYDVVTGLEVQKAVVMGLQYATLFYALDETELYDMNIQHTCLLSRCSFYTYSDMLKTECFQSQSVDNVSELIMAYVFSDGDAFYTQEEADDRSVKMKVDNWFNYVALQWHCPFDGGKYRKVESDGLNMNSFWNETVFVNGCCDHTFAKLVYRVYEPALLNAMQTITVVKQEEFFIPMKKDLHNIQPFSVRDCVKRICKLLPHYVALKETAERNKSFCVNFNHLYCLEEAVEEKKRNY